MKLDFPRQIFEKYVSNVMVIHPVGAEFFHSDRQTDIRDEGNNLFRSFANALRNACSLSALTHTCAWPVA
jgi:hypothetical protein